MRPFFACLALLLTGLSCAAAPAAPRILPPDTPEIAYMGRLSLDATRAAIGFPGVTIRFAYKGPAPVLLLKASSPDCYFNLSCNRWDPVIIRLKQGENRIALPTGTAPEAGFLIELARRTESWMGTCEFLGLELPEGSQLLQPPAFPDRKILFIGDSITCAEYVERFPPEDEHSPRATNATRSYAMILARWLGAQSHLIAYGGQGLFRDWAGLENTQNLPTIFERALPDSPELAWDHARYTPDLVVVNVGTDYDKGLPDQERMAATYRSFVDRIRAVHPQAWIMLCESSFQSDGSDGRARTERDLLRKAMESVVAHRAAAGDTRIQILNARFYPGTPADGHVVAFQQEQLALELLPPIRKALGW